MQKLSVVLALPDLSAVVDMGRDETVSLNGMPLALPFHAPNSNFSIVKVCFWLGSIFFLQFAKEKIKQKQVFSHICCTAANLDYSSDWYGVSKSQTVCDSLQNLPLFFSFGIDPTIFFKLHLG